MDPTRRQFHTKQIIMSIGLKTQTLEQQVSERNFLVAQGYVPVLPTAMVCCPRLAPRAAGVREDHPRALSPTRFPSHKQNPLLFCVSPQYSLVNVLFVHVMVKTHSYTQKYILFSLMSCCNVIQLYTDTYLRVLLHRWLLLWNHKGWWPPATIRSYTTNSF